MSDETKAKQLAKRIGSHRSPETRAKMSEAQAATWTNGQRSGVASGLSRRGPLYGLYLKAEIVRIYGGACECCGEQEITFLTVDHVNGDGGAKRRSGEDSPSKFYRRLAKAGHRLDGYRLACMNCNWATRFGAPCPHALHADEYETAAVLAA